MNKPILDDELLDYYSRQIKLPQLGEEGQARLYGSRALIIGMGGLGSPAAMYLAAAGIGNITVSDFDRVEASNLQRQIVHRARDIGALKAHSAKATLQELNPHAKVTAVDWELDEDELQRHVEAADVVVDCSDNFATRFALNAACFRHGTPLVSGAAIRFEGQVSTFLPEDPDSPCYRCLYPDSDAAAETCPAEGILAPVVGIIGSIQALEAVKVLGGLGRTLCGRLLLVDALSMECHTIRLPKDAACPVCGDRAPPAPGK